MPLATRTFIEQQAAESKPPWRIDFGCEKKGLVSLKSLLGNRGLLTASLLPTEIDAFLSALEVQDPVPQTSPADGFVKLGVDTSFAFFALNLKPPGQQFLFIWRRAWR
jgi:hypothetical protein